MPDNDMRAGEIADALQILQQRAAVVALIEMELELRSADRPQGAVDHLLNRVGVLPVSHFIMPRGPAPGDPVLPVANLTKKRAQAHPRLVHLRLRRPFGDAEDLGDFLVLEALDVVQHERRTASFRQHGDRAWILEHALAERSAEIFAQTGLYIPCAVLDVTAR